MITLAAAITGVRSHPYSINNFPKQVYRRLRKPQLTADLTVWHYLKLAMCAATQCR
jgi:hypothetical protein